MVRQHLRVVSWNANNVIQKKHEVSTFVQDNDVNMFSLQEICLHPRNTLTLPNYTLYRTDSLNGFAGCTAIAIKQSIPHYVSAKQSQIVLPLKPLPSLYPPCKISPLPPRSHLSLIRIIISGDFNAKKSLLGLPHYHCT